MGFFKKIAGRIKRNQLSNAAIDARFDKDYRTAAEDFAAEADYYYDENKLIFASSCLKSSSCWVKLGDADNALGQARRGLQAYIVDGWFDNERYRNDCQKDITDVIAEMSDAGLGVAGDALLTDLNKALADVGQPPLNIRVYTTGRPFPDSCPSCGGEINYTGNLDVIPCPFCGKNVHCL